MIAVLGWTDGFGNDTVVYGIFDSVEKAQECYYKNEEDILTYQEISLNETVDLNYYESPRLFPNRKYEEDEEEW